jgi:hypothetical protein
MSHDDPPPTTRPENKRPLPVPGVPGMKIPPERRHPAAEPSTPPARSISPFPQHLVPPTESKRIAAAAASSPWILLIVTAGKWIAGISAPFLAGGALWLYSEIEKQKAEAAKLRAEAEAIVDARKLLDNDVRKVRECLQKLQTWLPQDDRLKRAVLEKLGARIEGAPEYTDVEFKPAPLTKGIKRDAAPPVQPVDSLPVAPECEF